ncbi:hypothetical protein SY88_19520 [Clostridiales bacterium PH28_bin88]|nr:hypothetical protein SY88_19520 [Clostridiales bacterium PH28_bin88]
MKNNEKEPAIHRGDLFLADLGPGADGNRLLRPVLVIQNDIGNRFCDTVIVVPLTASFKAKRLLFSVLIPRGAETGLCGDHIALFSQIRTLPRSQFHPENRLGRSDANTMTQVDQAIQLSLGLSTLQKLQNRTRSRRKSS